MWHKPQKSAETQSFSPLLSNLNQGNNDFQYVPVLNTILNSPLEVEPEAYAVFSDGTLTFYFDGNKPVGAYGMRTNDMDEWSDVAKQITKVVFNESFADYRPTSCAYWFYGCNNLTIIEGMKEYLNTDNVTEMGSMFYYCISLTTLDVSNFKTDNVTNMDKMFDYCSNLTTLDVSNFKTDNVTNMGEMFSNCSSLTTLDVSNFKTDNVTYMGDMFYYCSNLTTLDVSNFNTDNVTRMGGMFSNCSSLTTLDVSNFNTEKVTYMYNMFVGCSSLQTIYVGDKWTPKNVTASEYMFYGCNNLYGGKGTAYNADFINATYANIDAPENGKPGYFTKVGEQPWVPVSIAVTTLPNKTEYNIGDDLNLEGGKLTATFPDNSTKTASLSNAKVSGFDNTKTGEQTITVTWLGKETSFTVTVKEDTREVDWVGTNTAILLGTPFESIWMDVRYKNGDWERKTFSDSQVNVTGLNTDVAGVQNVTITYHGFVWNVTFEVYKPIASFDFSIVNTNLNLNANEKLSGFVTVTNEDGTTYEVDVNQMLINIYHETEGYWSLYAIDDDNAYDKTLGEHEFIVNYRDHQSNLKYTFYDGPAPAKPYVILADNTITFYAGQEIPEGAYELKSSYSSYDWSTPWIWSGYETVVFDESFKEYKPTSTAFWFHMGFALKEIKGIENLNTERVTDMSGMFYSCFNLKSIDLSGLNVSNVTNMDCMFTSCYFLHTIYVDDAWILSDNLSSDGMFRDCPSLYGEQGSMPISYEVYDASYARIDGGDNVPGYFTKKGNAKANVASIDFDVKPYVEHILGAPLNRNDAILNVNFENRETQHLPYAYFVSTTSGYDSTKVGKQTVTVKLLNATTTYEVNVTAKDTSYAYLDDNGVLTLYYGEYKQGALFDSNNQFSNPSAVNKVVIDKSFADFRPTTCARWFYDFNNMTEIEGLENINTQYVTDMSQMFSWCKSLETLDISSFNTANVTNMEGMFNCCSKLKTLYIGDNWNIDAVKNSGDMFWDCPSLVGGKGTAYNSDFTDATYARVDGGADAPGYFTYKISAQADPREPYALLSDNGETVTFYYDKDKSQHEDAFGLDAIGRPQWSGWKTAWASAKVAIFDESFKEYKPTSCAYWFYGCDNLTEIRNLDYLNTENVTTMSEMFDGCSSLTSIDLSNFNTEKVTNMTAMFSDCHSLVELDLSSFNTSNVTYMESMFGGCSNLKSLNISTFNIEKVVYMDGMFAYCLSLSTLDLSSFDTKNVTSMDGMFGDCVNLKTIYVTNSWNVDAVTSPHGIFDGCEKLYGEKGTECVPGVEELNYVHIDEGESNPGYFTQKGHTPYTPPSIDYTQVQPYAVLSNGVLTFYYNNKRPEESFSMRKFDISWGSIAGYTFTKAVFDPSFVDYRPTSLANWFAECEALKEIDGLEYLNTEKVTDLSEMFMDCNIKTLDLSSFNTANVTNMAAMFMGCENLETLDLSDFNTAKVTDMESMFEGCKNLKTIYVGDNWKTENVKKSRDMFDGCEKIVGGKGTVYKGHDIAYARIDEPENDAPGYFTYKMVVSPIDTTLTSSPTKLEYIEGQELDLTGGEITITYNDETTETIDLTDANVTLSEFDNTKTGDQTIKVFLKGEEVGTFTVNVKAKSVVSIALIAPKKLEYVEGTSLDLKDGKITITYDNETSEDIPLTDEKVTISEFDNTTLGEKTLTVNYNGEKVDDFKINVVAKSVASIRVTKSPEKLTYKKGEVLSVDDGEITVTYNNQTTEILAFTAEGVTISDIDNTKLGAQSITVTYSEKVATFNITVVPDKEILSITISKLPKTEYFAGEDLNISDGELTITYSDETTETAKLSIAKLSGFNSETVGKQTIKVTYLEKETTFEVNVKAVEIVSIELTTAPTKLEYIENEEFSAEGGEITVTFNNETTQKVALTDEKVSISGFDNSKIGEQVLKIVYSEKETELKVKVVAKSLVKIAISTQPTKVEYLEGEAFSADGGEFVAYYNNNSSETLDLSKATISGFDNSKIGEQTLKVVYNEKETELKVKVVAKPEPQPEPEPEPVVENPYTKPELKDGFYQISTAEELLWFVFDVNSGDTKANAALTKDIVINQDCLEHVIKLLGISKADGDLTVWQPIGTFEHAFAGIFDGQGHSISGLFINDKTLDNAGLFGAIASEAVVKNVGVVDSYISGGKNVGAICGQSEGKIENCYSLSEVKGTENVNGIAGKVETVSNVENCYYLADTPNADDPQAKTAAEFKSGEVAQLLAKGGEAWKNVKELPGVESVVVPEPEPQIENPDNPETATEDITLSSVKIWSFEKTIFVENAVNEIVIIDLTGRVVKNVAPDSNRMEIQLNKGGIFIVKTGLSTKKVSVK